MGYDFRIECKPGKSNNSADALSSVEEADTVLLMTASRPIPLFLKKENTTLDDLRLLHNNYGEGKLLSDYVIRDGILYFQNKYFILF